MTDEKEHANGEKKGNGKPISLHPLTGEQVVKAMVETLPPSGRITDDDMRSDASRSVLVPGMRVELTGTPTAVTFRSRTGRIVRDDEFDDYVIVALDIPAQYRHFNGEVEDLPEIAVMTDSLRALGR